MQHKGFLQRVFDASAGAAAKLDARITQNNTKMMDYLKKEFAPHEEQVGEALAAVRAGYTATGQKFLKAPCVAVREVTKQVAKLLRRPVTL